MHLALAEEIKIANQGTYPGNNGDIWKEQWEKTFSNCFLKVDAEIEGAREDLDGRSTNIETKHDPNLPDTVGSTAVVAIVCPTYIVVANCGDSRAVLCRGKVPVPLSIDHKVRSLECANLKHMYTAIF